MKTFSRLLIVALVVLVNCQCESQMIIDSHRFNGGYLVFLVRGNSIAAGAGDAASPNASAGTVYEWDQTNDVLIDRATTEFSTTAPGFGSPWKQFAINMNAATGKKIVIIACGLSGAEVFPNGGTNTHWAPHYDNAGAAVPAGTGSTIYTTSVTEANACLAFLNKTSLDGIFDIVGINDARGAATLANISLGFTDFYDQTATDFPGVPIYATTIGRSETESLDSRKATIKRYIRQLADNRSYYNIVVNLSSFSAEAWDLYRADLLHPTQVGNNLIGEMYARYLNYSETNKEVKQVWNIFKDELSTAHKAAWKTWVEAQEANGNWDLLDSFTPAVGTSRENVLVDARLLGAPIDDGFTFTANTSIRCTGAAGLRRVSIMPEHSWIYGTQSDFIVGTKLVTNNSAAGAVGYLFGARSLVPTTEMSLAQLAASLQYECNDATATTNGTHTRLQDNTVYSIYRSSGTKGLNAGTTNLATAAVASTGFVDVILWEGARNNNNTLSGALDVTIEYSFQAKHTGFNLSSFISDTATLITALQTP